jgi:hypothetical protein
MSKKLTTRQIECDAVAEANKALAVLEANAAITRVRQALEAFDESALLKPENWVTGDGVDKLGNLVEMSDKAKAELMIKVNRLMLDHAKTLNELRRTEFEFSKDMHIPRAVLEIMIVEILRLGQGICKTKDEYDTFAAGLKKILQNTRNANVMYAEVQTSADDLPDEEPTDG